MCMNIYDNAIIVNSKNWKSEALSELKDKGVKILGTQPSAIEIAEDRQLFKEIIEKLNLKQPKNKTINSKKATNKISLIVHILSPSCFADL